MSLCKLGNILTDAQQRSVLADINGRKNGKCDTIMFLLSVDIGLRAKEIASCTWKMPTDAEGNLSDEISPQNKAIKAKAVVGSASARCYSENCLTLLSGSKRYSGLAGQEQL